ncbi:MAG: hypothetical protein HOB32_08240, partial [Nitrospina sp.]|nr:hypothetical protein [Nitrospina sp.]
MSKKAHKISDNIPKDSPLYSYLVTKEETGVSVGLSATLVQEPNFVDLNTDYKNSKVLLINPPMCSPKGLTKKGIPPAAIAYVAGSLREVGIEVELLDCIIEGWCNEELIDEKNEIYTYGMSDEAVADYLAESKPGIIGLSLVFSQDLRNLCKISRVAKK